MGIPSSPNAAAYPGSGRTVDGRPASASNNYNEDGSPSNGGIPDNGSSRGSDNEQFDSDRDSYPTWRQ